MKRYFGLFLLLLTLPFCILNVEALEDNKKDSLVVENIPIINNEDINKGEDNLGENQVSDEEDNEDKQEEPKDPLILNNNLTTGAIIDEQNDLSIPDESEKEVDSSDSVEGSEPNSLDVLKKADGGLKVVKAVVPNLLEEAVSSIDLDFVQEVEFGKDVIVNKPEDTIKEMILDQIEGFDDLEAEVKISTNKIYIFSSEIEFTVDITSGEYVVTRNGTYTVLSIVRVFFDDEDYLNKALELLKLDYLYSDTISDVDNFVYGDSLMKEGLDVYLNSKDGEYFGKIIVKVSKPTQESVAKKIVKYIRPLKLTSRQIDFLSDDVTSEIKDYLKEYVEVIIGDLDEMNLGIHVDTIDIESKTVDIYIYDTTDDDEYYGDYFTNQTLFLSFSNDDDYSEDEYNLINKEYSKASYDYRLYIPLGDQESFDKVDVKEELTQKLNKLFVDDSITVLYGSIDLEEDNEYKRAYTEAYIFKNDVFYKKIYVDLLVYYSLSIPKNVDDTADAYIEYAKPKITKWLIDSKKVENVDELFVDFANTTNIFYYIVNPVFNEKSELEDTDYTGMVALVKDGSDLIAPNISISSGYDGVFAYEENLDGEDVSEEVSEMTATAKAKGYNTIYKAFQIEAPDGTDLSGGLNITFVLGAEYNNKEAIVLHKKHDGSIESFVSTVKDGKVTVTVYELSPFLLSTRVKTPNKQNTVVKKNNSKTKNEKESTTTTTTTKKIEPTTENIKSSENQNKTWLYVVIGTLVVLIIAYLVRLLFKESR